MRRFFPFSALVGQDLLKKGLLANAVDPSIGGVLLRGEKGTGKTTAVRSFAAVLPPKEAAAGCRFGCLKGTPPCGECLAREASGEVLAYEERPMEVVDLPLNASEDRVVGSLDLEAALREGSRKFEMGVLGRANGNVLYIDEVNLLDDHVVDVLLDVSVSGVNVVMREGVSCRHPSRFLLVGTMNPEEGELRPQLLDRFGLCVEISGERDAAARKTIVERVLLFEKEDPAFLEAWGREDRALRSAVLGARRRLRRVRLRERLVDAVAEVNNTLEIPGHRGDLAILKTARALAALRGGEEPAAADLRDAIRLALPHRVPPAGIYAAQAYRVEQLLSQAFPGENVEEEDRGPVVPLPGTAHGAKRGGVVFRSMSAAARVREREAFARAASARHRYDSAEAARGDAPTTCGDPDCDYCQGYAEATIAAPADPYEIRKIAAPKERRPSEAPGKRSKSLTKGSRGRYVRSVPWEKGRDVAIDATLLAAAAGRHAVRPAGGIRISAGDLRGKRRERKAGNLVLVVLDASASMETQQRMAATKGAVLSLLRDAYVKRDRVGLISFRDTVAEVVVPPTGSVSLAAARLAWLASGGTTPLSIGLFAALKTLETERRRDPSRRPVLAVITDGRANVSYFGGQPMEEAVRIAKAIRKTRATSLVVDTDRMTAGPAALRSAMEAVQKSAGTRGIFSDGPARTVADAMGAKYWSLAEISRSAILKAIRSRMAL